MQAFHTGCVQSIKKLLEGNSFKIGLVRPCIFTANSNPTSMKQQFMSKLMFQTLDCDILNTFQCFWLFKLQGRSLFNRMIDLFGVKNHGLTRPILNELPSNFIASSARRCFLCVASFEILLTFVQTIVFDTYREKIDTAHCSATDTHIKGDTIM